MRLYSNCCNGFGQPDEKEIIIHEPPLIVRFPCPSENGANMLCRMPNIQINAELLDYAET